MEKGSLQASIVPAQPRLKALSLRANFSWAFAGNFIYSGCQWGILIAIAKLGNPEMVGQFVLGLTLTAPIFMFSNLELTKIQGTDVQQEYTFGDFLGLRLIMTALALVGTLGITLISGYRMSTALIILGVGFSKAVEVISDILFGLFQRHERMDRVGISLLIKGPVNLAALALGLYFTGSILGGIIGLIGARVLILVAYDLPNGALILKANSVDLSSTTDKQSWHLTRLRPRWHKATLIRLIWLTLPLGFMVMLRTLNSSIPRYFLERSAGERELGFFAALAYIKVVGETAVNAMAQSANPRLATYYSTGQLARFRKILLGLMIIGALIGGTGVLAAWIAGREFLILFYGPEYGEYSGVFVWIMAAAGILYIESFVTYSIVAIRFHRVQSIFFVFAVVATIIASIILIPGGGIQGTANVLIFTAVFRLVGGLTILVYANSRLQRNTVRCEN